MSKGFTGKVIKINLSLKKIEIECIEEKIYRKYLGGSALASYFLLKELKPGIDPFSEENILVFTTSILSGTTIPGATRYTVASKSPLTGAFGEAEAGGYWAPQLKKAGFDAIVIKGCADKLSYILIHNGKV
jgi:aldehyde:ferredoxin oxidoreductase